MKRRRTSIFVANMKNANTTLIGILIIGVLILYKVLGTSQTREFIETILFLLTALGLINAKDAIMEDYPEENKKEK